MLETFVDLEEGKRGRCAKVNVPWVLESPDIAFFSKTNLSFRMIQNDYCWLRDLIAVSPHRWSIYSEQLKKKKKRETEKQNHGTIERIERGVINKKIR